MQTPNDPDIHLNIGVALKELGQRAEARQCFERVLELNPRSADAWVNLGTIAKAERDYQRAIECYQQALEINPQSTLAFNNWGAACRLRASPPRRSRISNGRWRSIPTTPRRKQPGRYLSRAG